MLNHAIWQPCRPIEEQGKSRLSAVAVQVNQNIQLGLPHVARKLGIREAADPPDAVLGMVNVSTAR